jgi:hypothetical protein
MATYTQISDIKKDFGLDTDDIAELKRELKELIKDIHPDKNNGQFKNKLDELNYQKILSALDYLNQDFAIVPRSELTALTTIIKDNFPAKREETQIKNLEDKIDKVIKVYKDSNLTPKISSTVLATILTFIWLFPGTVKDHPILSHYLTPTNIIFTTFWFYSLLLTAAYWLFAKRNEERLKEATKKLNLESVQNKLFRSFSEMKVYRAEKENKNYFTFSKDELIEHLTDLNTFTLEYEPERRRRANNPLNVFSIVLGRNRNIDLELAQTLTDIVIERAKRKNLIQLEQDHNLADTFRHQLSDKPDKKSNGEAEN